MSLVNTAPPKMLRSRFRVNSDLPRSHGCQSTRDETWYSSKRSTRHTVNCWFRDLHKFFFQKSELSSSAPTRAIIQEWHSASGAPKQCRFDSRCESIQQCQHFSLISSGTKLFDIGKDSIRALLLSPPPEARPFEHIAGARTVAVD